MSRVQLEYQSTRDLISLYDQQRTWLATHTESEAFESEHEYYVSIGKELGTRKIDRYVRLSVLHNALEQTNSTGYFTVGERICVNQERGYLLSVGGQEELRIYQVSEELENKIKQLK